MNEALSAIGAMSGGYAVPDVRGVRVDATYLNEVINRAH